MEYYKNMPLSSSSATLFCPVLDIRLPSLVPLLLIFSDLALVSTCSFYNICHRTERYHKIMTGIPGILLRILGFNCVVFFVQWPTTIVVHHSSWIVIFYVNDVGFVPYPSICCLSTSSFGCPHLSPHMFGKSRGEFWHDTLVE